MRGVEDLIGVGVADATHEARIGQGAFQRVVFGGEGRAEGFEVALRTSIPPGSTDRRPSSPLTMCSDARRFEPASVECQRALRKIESGEVLAAREFDFRGTPVQPSGDHQMEHQPDIALDSDRDSFADTADFANCAAFRVGDGWLRGAEQKGVGDADAFERLPEDARLERVRVGENVRQFRHARIIFTLERWGTVLRAERGGGRSRRSRRR